MRTLDIKSFSCIDRASLQVNDLTVIIGPQASGKSVICKLFYFFNGIFSNLPHWVTDARTPTELKDRILEEFSDWFQPPSWGTKQFVITFTTGEHVFTVSRVKTRNGSPKAKLVLSERAEQLLESVADVYAKTTSAAKGQAERELDPFYRSFTVVRKYIEKSLGNELPEDQLYIPAGRSFFTSVGKIVTAFEDRSVLDPLVAYFGRLVTNLRESSFYEREIPSPLLKNLEMLLGGKVVQERGKQYLATDDGRSIPFNALSSGQQELLPLLYALRFTLWREKASLTFVEEPEAHLFPSAQTSLVEMFAQMVAVPRRRTQSSKTAVARRLVITTHSPYVLAKINTLIKAGQLARGIPVERRKELEAIVPAVSWIAPGRASAYAIHDRKLIPILDDYGLINSDYIDSVSEHTGMEFDSLLDLEASL